MPTTEQIKIDFQVIETRDPKYLMIGDTSMWYYAEEKPSYILITPPGSSKVFQTSFKKKSISIFNSNNFGITCFTNDCIDEEYQDLPDGIYTICVKSSFLGSEKTRYYLKTDRFETELRKTIIKNGLEYDENDKDFRDTIYQIKWLLDTAKSWVSEGDFVKANRYFNKAIGCLNEYNMCNK